MSFEALRQTNQKLAANPELSEHNKEVLNDFFRTARSKGARDPTLADYASRFNKLAEIVDFKLDQPDKSDLENLVNAFNTNDIRKNNGEKYSGYSKEKFAKTLSKFYKSFIGRIERGYNPEIDGEELIEGLEINATTSTKVDPDQLPTPKQVRKVANHANSLRDKALILFGWATGGRVGEMFVTNYDEDPIKWKDIEFQEDRMWVKISEEGKDRRGKSARSREIILKVSMPAMKQLWNEENSNVSDPVFTKSSRTYYCPECGTKTTGNQRHSYENRVYQCRNKDCSWEGGNGKVDKVLEPLTDDAVRRIVERCAERAGLKEKLNCNPHDFFRKSRAIHRARIGYTEHQMRGFFGWAETSDAPKHYIEVTKEDLEKAFAEEYGEDVDYESGYDEDALRPIQCVQCGTVNSPTEDLCRECSNALNEQAEELTRDEEPDFKQNLLDLLESEDPADDQEDIEEELNKPLIQFLKENA